MLSKPYSLEKDLASLIHTLAPIPLSNVPFHENTASITRFFAQHFPVHLAVHEVSPISSPPPIYTIPHIHDDSDELNIIISRRKLIYTIQLGNEQFTVTNNSAIYIPRGTLHSANVQKGHGYFITLRIN
jgi:mannose-6-phosphate isomerase-like protein (cupin superfamily)